MKEALLYSWAYYRLDMNILEKAVIPKAQGDIFGQIASAFLVVRCSSLRLLSAVRTFSRSGYLELCDGMERIKITLDVKSEDHYWPCVGDSKHVGTMGLLLQSAPLGDNKFIRVGTFWIDHAESFFYFPDLTWRQEKGDLAETMNSTGPERQTAHIKDPSPIADLHIDHSGVSVGPRRERCFCSRYPTKTLKQLVRDSIGSPERDEYLTRKENYPSPEADDLTAEDYQEKLDWRVKNYRSVIWDTLQKAPMQKRAPTSSDANASEETEEKFIIILV